MYKVTSNSPLDVFTPKNAVSKMTVNQCKIRLLHSFSGKGQIIENRSYGLIRIQIFKGDTETLVSISKKTGLTLPASNSAISEGGKILFWSAPLEWIMAVPLEKEIELVQQMSERLSDVLSVVTTITASRTLLELSGSEVRQLLAKGSAVDFHKYQFVSGNCVTTKFAKITVMIALVNNQDKFLLLVDRSYAAYFMDYLIDSCFDI